MRHLIVAFCLGLVAPACAAQPIRESLVECSVLIELMIGEETPIPGESEMLDLYVRAAEGMRAEAKTRSSPNYVTQVAAAKREVWHQRWENGNWDLPKNCGELAEWITYCFKLGKHLNLKL